MSCPFEEDEASVLSDPITKPVLRSKALRSSFVPLKNSTGTLGGMAPMWSIGAMRSASRFGICLLPVGSNQLLAQQLRLSLVNLFEVVASYVR